MVNWKESKFKSYLKKVGVEPSEIYVLLTVFLVILIVPFLLMCFWTNPSFGNTGIVGDTFGGLTAPLLSFFGSVLVYFALKSQIKANKIITDQFVEQNQDQLFFRLFDSLEVKIRILNVKGEDKISKLGIDGLHEIIKEYHKLMYKNGYWLAHTILIKKPSILDEEDYSVIAKYTQSPNTDWKTKAKDIKANLLSTEAAFRPEFVQTLINDKGNSNMIWNDVMSNIAKNQFYNVDFSDRKYVYSNAMNDLSKIHKGFLDGYFSTFEYLLKFIFNIKNNTQQDNENRQFYLDNLFYNSSDFEKQLLLYRIVWQKTIDEQFVINLKSFFRNRTLKFENELMYDNPTDFDKENEISNILTNND